MYFKQLKIILAQINHTVSRSFLPSVFIVFCFTNILSTFIYVSHARTGDLFNNFGHLVFLPISLETNAGIICLETLPGLVNHNSVKFLGALSTSKDSKLGASFKKDVTAFSRMKIRFGSNFVDILTPLVMISLCIKWTVKLLLISN